MSGASAGGTPPRAPRGRRRGWPRERFGGIAWRRLTETSRSRKRSSRDHRHCHDTRLSPRSKSTCLAAPVGVRTRPDAALGANLPPAMAGATQGRRAVRMAVPVQACQRGACVRRTARAPCRHLPVRRSPSCPSRAAGCSWGRDMQGAMATSFLGQAVQAPRAAKPAHGRGSLQASPGSSPCPPGGAVGLSVGPSLGARGAQPESAAGAMLISDFRRGGASARVPAPARLRPTPSPRRGGAGPRVPGIRWAAGVRQ